MSISCESCRDGIVPSHSFVFSKFTNERSTIEKNEVRVNSRFVVHTLDQCKLFPA